MIEAWVLGWIEKPFGLSFTSLTYTCKGGEKGGLGTPKRFWTAEVSLCTQYKILLYRTDGKPENGIQ